MITKTQKQQKYVIRCQHRAAHERLGSIALAIVTLIGLTMAGRHERNVAKETTLRPSAIFSQVLERENETARIPVKLDQGLRLPTISGN